MAWVVIKFGGTSVSSRATWDQIAGIIRGHREKGKKVLVVCSALSGVTNLLSSWCQTGDVSERARLALLHELNTRYATLASELGVDASCFEAMRSLSEQVTTAWCLSPRPAQQASVLALGERWLTACGEAFLKAHFDTVTAQHACDLLESVVLPRTESAAYLSAQCGVDENPILQKTLNSLSADVIVTQGFMARNEHGETVLLGRGGSDASAAYLAAHLKAECCEIWTDVPGVYSANPHLISEARVLEKLTYDEAQEIAAMGAKVLHHCTLWPLKQAQVPLFIKQTLHPERPGTYVGTDVEHGRPVIKAIVVKKSIVLISIDAVDMWHSIGFMASIYACFEKHGLSVDLTSTSEANVTLTLDKEANCMNAEALNAVLADLNTFSKARVIAPCASVSFIGSRVNAVLSLLDKEKIYLLSQAANDLNVTVVVDDDKAEKLVQQCHHALIESTRDWQVFGPTWNELQDSPETCEVPWWEKKREQLCELAKGKPGIYVYDKDTIAASVADLRSLGAIDHLFYAMKANSNPLVLKHVYELGMSFECVSLGEMQKVRELFPDLTPDRVLFTPNFAPKEEYAYAFEWGTHVTIDNRYPLEAWGDLLAGKSIMLRLDPGQGKGHHKHVMTAGKDAKFGVPIDQLEDVAAMAKAIGCDVVGLHAHVGSGILQADNWLELASCLVDYRSLFPKLQRLNLGGGLGIVEKPWQQALDMSAIDTHLQRFKAAYPDISLWLEPGRYVVARSGVLLASVTQIRHKADQIFVGVSAGMNALIRPALYGSYHPIHNLTRLGEALTMTAHVVGPNCESADVLGRSRSLPQCQEGDIICVGNAGAYGEVMKSGYNSRTIAESVLV